MKNMKCPNCAGTLILNTSKRMKECPYCDSKFKSDGMVIDKDEEYKIEDIENTENKLVFNLFDFKNEKAPCKQALISLKSACALINENTTVEGYIDKIKRNVKNNFDYSGGSFAFVDDNPDLLQKVMFRVNSLITTDEKCLLYKDSGIFSHAKSGILLTDKKIYSIKKKGTQSLAFEKIHSLGYSSMGSNWYFNHEQVAWKYEVDSIACDEECVGMIIALICTLAREKNSAGYKIKLTSI